MMGYPKEETVNGQQPSVRTRSFGSLSHDLAKAIAERDEALAMCEWLAGICAEADSDMAHEFGRPEDAKQKDYFIEQAREAVQS